MIDATIEGDSSYSAFYVRVYLNPGKTNGVKSYGQVFLRRRVWSTKLKALKK